jgi:hypothetical protein
MRFGHRQFPRHIAEGFSGCRVNRVYQSWTKGAKMQPLRINAGVRAFAAAVIKEIARPTEA